MNSDKGTCRSNHTTCQIRIMTAQLRCSRRSSCGSKCRTRNSSEPLMEASLVASTRPADSEAMSGKCTIVIIRQSMTYPISSSFTRSSCNSSRGNGSEIYRSRITRARRTSGKSTRWSNRGRAMQVEGTHQPSEAILGMSSTGT